MKRSVKVLIVVLALLLLAAPVYAAKRVVITADLNVRKGPGKGYRVMGSVSEGTSLPYKNKSAKDDRGVRWYKVKYKNKTGWVSSRYSYLTSTSRKVVTTGNVNLRWGPARYYDEYTSVRKGKSLTYLGKYSYDDRGVKWYKVSYNGYGVWVSSRYSKLK
ncbi:MAG: SH3 domain-containing protein [Eubacterium sp.]|nr:SH3 domain-containing protein [Eubacterium sp.]